MRALAAAALAASLLVGCTALEGTERNGDSQDEILALANFARADVAAALADARAHNDRAAFQCYEVLIAKIDDLPTLTEGRVIGPVSAFQKARNVRRRVDEGFSEDVEIACAALASDSRDTLRRVLRVIRLATPL